MSIRDAPLQFQAPISQVRIYCACRYSSLASSPCLFCGLFAPYSWVEHARIGRSEVSSKEVSAWLLRDQGRSWLEKVCVTQDDGTRRGHQDPVAGACVCLLLPAATRCCRLDNDMTSNPQTVAPPASVSSRSS